MKILHGFSAQQGLSIALGLLVLAEHLAFGGNRTDLSLWFCLAQTTLLAICLSTSEGREAFGKIHNWWTLATLFGLLLIGVASALAPFSVERPGPWTAVDRAPIPAVYPLGVLVEICKLGGLASLFTLSAVLCVHRRQAYFLMKSLCATGLLFGLICLVLHGLSPVSVLGWTKPIIAQGRVSGLFSSANTAATVFGLYALLATGGILRTAERSTGATLFGVAGDILKSCGLEIATFLISVGCLLLTSSRGGITTFAPALALLLIWRSYKGDQAKMKGPALALGAIALAIVLVSGGFALERSMHAAVLNDQRPNWALAAWKLFTEAPLHGYGLGSLVQVFKTATTPQTYWTMSWAGAAHNVYLQWLVEGGLLAAIPLIALFGFMLDSTFLGLVEGDPAITWRRTLCACIFFVGLHSLVEYSLQEPSIAALFSVLLGAGVGLSSQRRLLRRGRSNPAFASAATSAQIGRDV